MSETNPERLMAPTGFEPASDNGFTVAHTERHAQRVSLSHRLLTTCFAVRSTVRFSTMAVFRHNALLIIVSSDVCLFSSVNLTDMEQVAMLPRTRLPMN